jgi:DNA repair protein RadA/Sms
VSPRWLGQCPACEEWDTLKEGMAPTGKRPRAVSAVGLPRPVPLGEVGALSEERIPTGVSELDRVLGGGIVPGSLVLIGGEPGIGKSTLVLQALAHMSASRPALLVTGEESPAQVRHRSQRLATSCDAVSVYPETRLEAVLAILESDPPGICAIDSVQTLTSDSLDSAPGSPAQVRQVTAELVRVAKERDVAMILVGQVTKDGGLAGPRLLEHLVDAVISFEGDDVRAQRVLRAVKNRFGSTNETGILEMRADGLASVDDPSDIYLAEAGERVGSCLFPAIEGSRAVLVEIQALVGPTDIVPPRRVAGGIDRTRLAQVLAVLGRHAGVRLGDQDVFVSVAGGARAPDPAADLAIALAVASAARGEPLPGPVAAMGEIGLTGALRPVGHAGRRMRVAADHTVARLLCGPLGDVAPETPRPGAVHPSTELRDAIREAFRPVGG